jgi:hypothetical protein
MPGRAGGVAPGGRSSGKLIKKLAPGDVVITSAVDRL